MKFQPGNGFLRSVYIWVDSSIVTAKADEEGSSFRSNIERTRNSRCRGGVEVEGGVHSIEFCLNRDDGTESLERDGHGP